LASRQGSGRHQDGLEQVDAEFFADVPERQTISFLRRLVAAEGGFGGIRFSRRK
jgi:hypothetical protein